MGGHSKDPFIPLSVPPFPCALSDLRGCGGHIPRLVCGGAGQILLQGRQWLQLGPAAAVSSWCHNWSHDTGVLCSKYSHWAAAGGVQLGTGNVFVFVGTLCCLSIHLAAGERMAA